MRRSIFVIAVAALLLGAQTAAPADDPGLSNDARFAHANATPQNGSGTDQGAYLPPLAGPSSEIVGTVVGDQTGPTSFYVGTVTDSGSTQYYRGTSDTHGRFHLRLPHIAGLVSLLLFKSFDRQGHPDRGASCQITDKPVHLENTEPATHIRASGPAIVEANSAYERGGVAQGIVQLHTRGTDALNSKVLLDGSARDVDTLAASDASMVGRLHDDVALGRHRVGAQSGEQRTNDQPADIVTERFDPIGPLRPGQVASVRLHIEGLGNDSAAVKWMVGGSASVADGSASTTAPVKDGVCDVKIRAREPGQLIIRTVLLVSLSEILGTLPDGIKITLPTPPPPTETPYPYTTEKPYGPGYRPPPCQPRIDGAFEPSQGVWQDDPKFDDHPTKQLTRPLLAVPDYLAELDMISYRDTLLFGVDHYELRGNINVKGWYHTTMRFAVVSDCSDPPKAVAMRFTLERGSSPPGRLLYTTPELAKIPLTGHHVPEKTYDLFVDCELGCPPPPAAPFRIAAFGEYLIKGELIDDKGGTGLAVTVHGNVHGTHSVKMAFLALILFPASDVAKKAIDDESEQLGIMSGRYIPDYYPMAAHGIEGWALDPIDYSATNIMNPTVERWDFPGTTPESIALHARFTRLDRVMAELSKQLDALAALAGYQRFVVVLPKEDFIALLGPGVLGLAETKKLLFIRSGEPYFVVAHELAHTLPWIWSEPQMNRDCSAPGNYHNEPVSWANGIRIDTAGVPGPRKIMDRSAPIMSGGDDPRYTWIAQCTYWNLANALRKKPDPPALLVRGIVSRSGGQFGAITWPYYDVDGILDEQSRPAASGEHWAIVYHSAAGRELASFPFEPQWTDENGTPRNIVPFSMQLPRMAGVASVELRGPAGLVLRRAVSASPPLVRIAAPGAAMRSGGAASVQLSWTATVAGGFVQRSTVLYSSDAGVSYHPRVFEQTVTNARVKIDPVAHKHRIKVIVTDGSRSSEQTIDFKT